MATYYSPTITNDGLIFHIDAANPKCFVSGDTTCTDLVNKFLITGANGQPNAGTHTPNTANFPSYNSVNGGVFDFAGGKGMNVEENLGSHSEFSLSMWFYKNSADGQYFTDARNDGGQWFLSNYTDDNINYTEVLTYNFDATYNASNTTYLNNWHHMVVTSNSGGSLLYLDGYEISVHPTYRNVYISNGSLDEDLGVNFRIGTRYTNSASWTGYMNLVSLYNRVLSSSEVANIFDNTRKRFGI